MIKRSDLMGYVDSQTFKKLASIPGARVEEIEPEPPSEEEKAEYMYWCCFGKHKEMPEEE